MPSIGKDLAKIRTSLGLTLQDIQATIKIPMATLEKIENDTIFEDSEFGETYVRSFIRSYGRALKIDSEVMINGLNQQETGNYNELLWNHYEVGQQSAKFKKFTFDDVQPSDDNQDEANQNELKTNPIIEAPKDKPSSALPPQTDAPEPKTTEPESVISKKVSSPRAPAENVNWADMGLKFKETKKTTPVWIFVTSILIVVAFAVGYFIYANDLFTFAGSSISDSEITALAANNGNLLLNLDEPVNVNGAGSTAGEELDEILYITVYAAYERLEPVRVWSDIKPRMDPYWIERGVAMNFDFRDTVRIRGQYTDMLIFKNGHAISDVLESNFNQQENYIELTREYFSSDPKWTSSQSIELPEEVAQPDTVMLRPTF